MNQRKKLPKHLLIRNFDYNLPDNRIAKHPLPNRDESKLLIYKDEVIREDVFANLSAHLKANSFIILNNTKVVEARLFFQNETGVTIEIFCLEPSAEHVNLTTAMLQTQKVVWKCLVGNARKWKTETLIKKISLHDRETKLIAKRISRQNDYFIIEFSWNDAALSFAEILHYTGAIPLPPYLHREARDEDAIRYQTIYADQKGSVAAPTAGLHFTDKLFKQLSLKNITREFITLHVGAGTFKPVKTETIEQHEMHAEYFEVNIALIEKLVTDPARKIIAVGTTTLRTLESLYWMGIKAGQQSAVNSQQKITVEDISVCQWDAYELNSENISVVKALQTLLHWMKENNIDKLMAKTQIIIAPPYKLKIASALVTNFHQPKSTLLLLVAAVVGDNWKKIYNYALQNNFRFLSYGDGCLLFPS